MQKKCLSRATTDFSEQHGWLGEEHLLSLGLMSNGKPWPRISIVTPSYNHGNYIEQTIKSVVTQGYPNLEYIIIDGGSTDSTSEIIRRYNTWLAYWISEKDQGQYDAINKGFAHSSGEIMAWLNSDDIYMPWTLKTVAEIFSEFPQIDWIMGVPSQIQASAVHNVRPCLPFPRKFIECGLVGGGDWGVVQQESCFWRKRLWQKAGQLQPQYTLAADFELWTRFAVHADLVCVDTLLGGFSVYGTNRSIVKREEYKEQMNTVIRALPMSVHEKRRSLLRGKAVYDQVKGVPGLRRLIRISCGLDRYDGVVLRRDMREHKYILERKAYRF